MKSLYSIRHFDANGGILRYEVANLATDSEAFRKVTAEPPALGCATIEIAREDMVVWRAEAMELGLSVH